MIENPGGPETKRSRRHGARDRKLDLAAQEWERTFDAVPDLIAIIDSQHRIVHANRAMAERLGMTPEQCVGLTCYGYVHGSEAPPSYCPQEQVLADGRAHTVEVYEKHLGGYFLISCTPLFDQDGRIVGTVHVARDITQRKQMEEDLRRSESILAQAGQMANLGAWEIQLSNHEDINQNRLRWSDQVYRIFGYEPGSVKVTYELFFRHVHPEDRQRVVEAVARGLARKQPYEVEHRIIRPDGTERTVREHADIRFDAQGRPMQMIGAVQDITESKRAEGELRQSEARLRAVMDVLPVGVFLADTQGRILSANPAASAIWGGRSPLPEVPPTCAEHKGWWMDTGRWVEPDEWALAAALRSGTTRGPREIEIACADGTHKTIIDYATPIRDLENRMVGVVAAQMDITARRQAENTLRESGEQFRRAIENASGAVVIATLEGGIVYTNPAFLRLVGYTEQELQAGLVRWDRITPPEYAAVDAEAIKELRQTGVAHPREKEYLTKDGRRVPVLVSGAITGYGPEGEPQIVAFVTDITSRKQIEAELRRWNDQLEQQVQARTEELRESVDRLNQEIARRIEAEEGLRKRSEMLEERAWQLQQLTLQLSQAEDRERKRLAEILHDDLQQLLAAAKFHLGLLNSRLHGNGEASALATTIMDLLREAIGKSRSLSHELSPPTLAHNDLHETLDWLAQQVQAKHGLTVHLKAFDRMELHSEPLKAFLYKAAQELLFNAAKHAQVKEAWLRLRRRRGRICLSVADKGRGFDPHRSANAGFGLLTIQERIRLLGGRMKVRSAKGKGSIFVLVVPDPEAQKAEDRGQRTEDSRPAEVPSSVVRRPSSVLRVLLVDDHKIVRQGIKAMLTEAPDIEVVGEAGNGREAVDLADQLAPDVVVMDMAMPVMAGDEATRQIKRHLPQTRIVALSMFDDSRVADRMRQAGAAAYLLKTAPTEELITAIRGQPMAHVKP